MNLCIPITQDEGLKSPVSGHFGSAPFFLIVDTESGQLRALPNRDSGHQHGMCRPLASIEGESVQAVAVGGIGPGALAKLQAANIQVLRTEHSTAEETLAAFRAGSLPMLQPQGCCGHHHHGHGGGHGHGHGHGGGCCS